MVALAVTGVVVLGGTTTARVWQGQQPDQTPVQQLAAVEQPMASPPSPSPPSSAPAEPDLERARAAARSARRDLVAAIDEATKTLDESEGKVADDAVRTALGRALDAAAAARDQPLGDATVDELREVAVQRTHSRDNLVDATEAVRKAATAWQAERDRDAAEFEAREDAAESEAREDAEADADAEAVAEGWHDAESAARCSAPDQVWTPENGHLPGSALATIPWSPGDQVRGDVIDGFVKLDAAFEQRFGRHLDINSSYRSHAEQEALYDPSSDTAAPPGCSNHGTGLAVDIGGGVERFGSPEYEWLKANAEAYGWVHPPFAEPGGRNPEPWHWQSVLAPNSY